MATQTILDHWSNRAKNSFVGRRIVDARYLTKGEMEALGWTKSALVLQLDDGTLLFPSRDDEGNNGGAMFGQQGKEFINFPTIDERLMDARQPTTIPVRLASSASTRRSEPARTGPSPQDPSSKRTEATLRRLLRKIQGGKETLHYNNEPSLLQLKEQGYIKRMAKVVRGRVPYFMVELSEKGKAA